MLIPLHKMTWYKQLQQHQYKGNDKPDTITISYFHQHITYYLGTSNTITITIYIIKEHLIWQF